MNMAIDTFLPSVKALGRYSCFWIWANSTRLSAIERSFCLEVSKLLAKVCGLIKVTLLFTQVDNPEGIFLSENSRYVWMRWNHLAKSFSLLSDLL